MTPHMSDEEVALLKSFLRRSKRYLEFGSGGSTCLAASFVTESIISVDSSLEWQDRVRQHCLIEKELRQPTFVHVDVGRTGEWGYPLDATTRDRWPNYHRDVWSHPGSSDADLYLVDGRFRIACFMQILLHSRRSSFVLIHDFSIRDSYHIVGEVARELAVAGSLSVFRCREDRNDTHVREILASYEYAPD